VGFYTLVTNGGQFQDRLSIVTSIITALYDLSDWYILKAQRFRFLFFKKKSGNLSVYFEYKKTGENRLKEIKNTKIRVKIGLERSG